MSPFEEDSRYHDLPMAHHELPDGRTVAYVRRRFLPDGGSLPLMTQVRVEQGDRIDRVTARTLGEPTHFWRIADANNAMDPTELVAVVGRVLRVPVPQA